MTLTSGNETTENARWTRPCIAYGGERWYAYYVSKPHGQRTDTMSNALYISAMTGTYHTSRECSVTRRNHAYNLDADHAHVVEWMTKHPGSPLKGCKRCGADAVIARAARLAAEVAAEASK